MIWDSSLETGHHLVDSQHQALFKAFNNLLDAMNQGKGGREIQETLLFLKDYTVKHFRMEESLMDRYQYPEGSSHKALHQGFVDKLADLLDRYERGAAVTISVMQLLKHWLLEHIQGTDKRLAKFVQQTK